jgi:AbiV family abortive infection protein
MGMSTDLTPEWSPDEPFIKGVLEHTADVLKGARALFDAGLQHLAYHLGLLALEEIGKLEVVLMGRVGTEEEAAAYWKKFHDDHVGKIFWAFWGPTFTKEMLDPRQIQWHQDLAKRLHEKRLLAIYTEPGNGTFIAPADHISPDEAKRLIELAEARLELQKGHKHGTLTEEEKADLVWFRAARYDQQKKTFILGPASMQRLTELGNTRDWMTWLRATVETQEAELLALAQAEMKRDVKEGDIDLPKWKIRIRIKTNSHIIKANTAKRWNEQGTPFEWKFIQKPDEFFVEFTLPKSIKAEALYEAGLGFCYRFITAVNIGTQGFFWFDLPLQTVRFHEQIIDLESNKLIDVGRFAPKRVNRTVGPITDNQIHWIMIAFGLLPHEPQKLFPFEKYAQGLMFWAKTDIHSGFEVEAFRLFFDCFTSAMHMYGDWDGKASTIRAAATKALAPSITSNIDDTVEEIFKLADAYMPGQPPPEVTIEQTGIMKLLADVYLLGALDREGMRRVHAEKAIAEALPPAPPA